MARRPETGHEIARARVYGNFRTPVWYRGRKPAWKLRQEKVEFNSVKHLAMLRQLECSVCGASPREYKIDPHHLRGGAWSYKRGIGQKTPDFATIPLCRFCHEEVERVPSHKQPAHFAKLGFNAEHLANSLAEVTLRRGSVADGQRVMLSFKLQSVATRPTREPVAGRRPRAYSVMPPADK